MKRSTNEKAAIILAVSVILSVTACSAEGVAYVDGNQSGTGFSSSSAATSGTIYEESTLPATVSVTPVPSAAFPPRAIRHLFKYSVSMFCSFFIRFPEVCRAGVLLWMHPRHCRNVPRRRFRYRFRSIRILWPSRRVCGARL